MSLDPIARKAPLGALLIASLTLAGCDESKQTAPTPPDAGPDAAVEPEPEPPQGIVPSHKARVKFKGGERYARDLAAALDLPRDTLCRELGTYDCVGDVHRIALGGVEPYELGVDDPLPVAPVSAAIAIDRVALSACTARVDRDIETPADAALFGPLLTGDPADAGVREGIAADLVDRILRRDATPDEVAALAGLWSDLEADADDPARAWAQLSCFAVATMLESLFY